jgi:hypothetical protein
MNRTMRWGCLAGGVLLAIQGIRLIVQKGDWVLLVLSILILAFSASSIVKNRETKP